MIIQFRANFQKIQNLEKFERLNRFWPNAISKILDRYIIFFEQLFFLLNC